MLHWIVEAVTVMGHDLDRLAPRALGGRRLRVPDLTEERRLGPRLGEYADPALAPRVPGDVAMVALHLALPIRVGEIRVRLDWFVGGGVEPALVLVRKPHIRQGGATVHPVATIRPVTERMPIGSQTLRMGKGETLLKDFLIRVELAKPRLVDLHRLAHLDVGRHQALVVLFVLQGEHGPEPSRTLPFHRGHLASKAVFVSEIGIVDPGSEPKPTFTPQRRGGHGHVEIAQRIARAVGVTPEPVELVAKDRGVHTVTAEHLGVEQGLLYGNGQPGPQAMVI